MSFRRFSYFRLYFSLVIICLLYAGVAYRHAYLAVDNQKFLLKKSQARARREIVIDSVKGQMLDRNDMLLSLSIPYYRFAINPKKHEYTEADIKKISEILLIDYKKLSSKIKNRKDAQYIKLQDRLSDSQIKRLNQLSWDGFIFEEMKGRYYPLGERASPLVGYVDIEGKGQIGAEYQFDDYMSGQDGRMVYTQNLLNQVTKVHQYQPPVPGKSLQLTIDYRLQYFVYQLIKDAVAYHDAEAAACVVLSAKTGEVMAMVSYPAFDPNARLSVYDDTTKNRVVMDLFEPGSTIKPFALAAILEHEDHDLDELMDAKEGHYAYQGHVFNDHVDMGVFPFREILVKSSNIAMVKLIETLPKEKLLNMYARFGLFSPTYIQLPGEVIGRHVLSPGKVDEAAMSYGYGLSANLLSLARAYNILANDGYDPGLHLVFEKHRPEPELIISKEIVSKIKEMMVLVTEEGVSSKRAQIKGMKVAGKSSTVHLLDSDKQYENEYSATFIGFAPSDQPKYVVAVVVHRPKKHGHFGGQIAAPTFAKVMKSAFNYLPGEK
jgi:cell division protein FtsI (penicillin-binding protein 3)